MPAGQAASSRLEKQGDGPTQGRDPGWRWCGGLYLRRRGAAETTQHGDLPPQEWPPCHSKYLDEGEKIPQNLCHIHNKV